MASGQPLPISHLIDEPDHVHEVAKIRDTLNIHEDLDDDADTASQRSISLSSPAASPRESVHVPTYESRRESHPFTISTVSSDRDDDSSSYETHPSSVTSPIPDDDHKLDFDPIPPSLSNTTVKNTYPPPQPQSAGRSSVASFATSTSSYSKKARPESMLIPPPTGPLVLGIAIVDFNHQVGPRIEFSEGAIFEDEEIAKILPFLALPDGAHLNVEDYSYFHLVPSTPNPSTIFGISCNRQIATSTLLVKEPDMTRSTVQKAVVILASRPVFGPVRERLGAITLALFEQKDFTDTQVLVDFYASLETSLRGQLTESGLYMGTNIRELVHEFRHRTLILVKALMLQKKIMFSGHPVERLCTSQYSLVSLIPGLLQTLEDCGSPPLASRAPTLTRPTSLKTSDRKSMLAYLGLPLDLFGQDAFFQPYIPLQQLDLVKSQTQSFLCGSTNAIVTQQKDIDLLVDIENGTVEFHDPKIERAVALTAADRKWMDEIVKDVNEGLEAEDGGMQRFKGSDDYLRIKFEEYIFAALASVKYGDFLAKGENSGVLIAPGSGGDANSLQDFNLIWIAEFKRTNAFAVWQRVTDPMIFDIIEPRHPCNEKPSAISDISLRLSEGIQELKLEQQFAPTREAISRTITAGSTNFLKAVEGVRGRWMQRSGSSASVDSTSSSATGTVEVSKSDVESISSLPTSPAPPQAPPPAEAPPAKAVVEVKEKIGTWGAGIGSFFASRAARSSVTSQTSETGPSSRPTSLSLGSSDVSPSNSSVGSPSLSKSEEASLGIAVAITTAAEGVAARETVSTPRPLILGTQSVVRDRLAPEGEDSTPRSMVFSVKGASYDRDYEDSDEDEPVQEHHAVAAPRSLGHDEEEDHERQRIDEPQTFGVAL